MKMNCNKMGIESFLSIEDNALALVLKTRHVQLGSGLFAIFGSPVARCNLQPITFAFWVLQDCSWKSLGNKQSVL